MLRQQIKDIYFALNRWLVLPNTWIARLRFRKPRHSAGHYLHLGCGATYIPGMINIDGNRMRKMDAWLDLRNRLPFANESAAFIYCSHTIEHLFPDEAMRLLGEMRRVIKSDGIVRIAVPCLEHALQIASGHPAEDPQRVFPDPHGQAIDYLFCDGQHKYGYSFSVLSEFAKKAGFTRIENYSQTYTTTPKTYDHVTVGNEPAGSLVVELRR
jgi:predicted SAM-dependent methyltransferase